MKTVNTKYLSFIVVLASLSPTQAQAYLDPGSGSMLLYFLIGIFTTLIYSIKKLFFRVRIEVSNLLSKDKIKLSDKKNIVFYSEDARYWVNFKPIIESLVRLGVGCSYYTGDKDDPGLEFMGDGFDSMFIGSGRFSLMSLNYLKSKILVMTTPQLEVMYLKRSSDVGYFVHLIHSPIDVYKYHPFAFDFFDCVMCSGQHQIDSLRLIEDARNTPKKKLLETGLVYFDELLKHKKESKKDKQKTVLIAPTWGDNGLLSQVGFKPLKLLLSSGFKVILRPHPQSFISESELVKSIENQCDEYDLITIDKDPNAQISMEQADILLSDASGIVFDFAFVYEKPVIAFNDTLNESRLLEMAKVSSVQKTAVNIWEVENRHKVSVEISINNIDELPKIVIQALDNYSANNIRKFREVSMFNYGCAGDVAAKQLNQLLNSV